MAVGEFQTGLQLDGELGTVGVPGAVVGGDIGAQLGSVVVLCVQEREYLNLHGVGAVVVGACRIKAGDLVGGADGDGIACRGIVLYAAACGKRCDGGHGYGGSHNLLSIHEEYLSLSPAPP